ncbi:MAG: hypothetical protein IKZ55_10940 [Bacteroidales bacterium]|nr:hypothetical protein [Bacteroidales bacterium]
MKNREGKIFDLKPQLTLAMKLAATFAITYYGLLLIFEVLVVVFRRYYFDSVYLNQEELTLNSHDFLIQIAQLALSVLLVFSLIQIFRKKVYGKAFFVSGTILLIVFQFIATGPIPILKYILEILMMLFIAPLRVKKKVRIKDGKVTLEEVKEVPEETEQPKQPAEPEQPKEKEPEA